MSKLDTLRKSLRIDEHGLELALRDHPELVYDVGIELAMAISHRDEAKQHLEEVESKVDHELRRAAAVAGEKTTEKEIESNKKLDKKVMAANDDFLFKKHEAAEWGVLKEAFEQRSYALSKLVDLYLANYYANIDTSGSGKFRDAKAEKVRSMRRASPE